MTNPLGARSFLADAETLKATLNVTHPFARAISAHMALTGLRGFWPMSAVDYQNPQCTDISGHGHDLTNNAGVVTFGYDPNGLAPIAEFGGAANQYLSLADAGANDWADIIGTEADIIAAQRGLTMGGWFYCAALPLIVTQYLIAKTDDGANTQYRLLLHWNGRIMFSVWPGWVTVISTNTVNVGWNHCVGIYNAPGQRLYTVLNGVVTEGAAPFPPAALADTAAAFAIGASSIGTWLYTGYASSCFLCAANVPQVEIEALRTQTKELYRA